MATKVTPGLITLSTPSASSNDTTPATTAYVTTAVANLADSAPSTLNTLNELAAALGDDANFSTTVTNSIAEKLPLAGGTMTGHILLNNAVELRSKDTGGTTRTITRINNSNELEYGYSGSGPVKFMGGGGYTERMRIHTDGNIGIGTTSPAQKLDVNGYIKATRIGAGISPIVPCEVLSTGSTSTALRVLKSGSDDSTQNNLFSVTEISGHGRLSIHDSAQNEEVRFDSNGASFLSDGLSFDGTTTAASVLDDYEEGTWTPSITGAYGLAYSSQVGTYTKIGRLVVVNFTFVLSTAPTSGSNTYITMPFTPSGSTTHSFGAPFSRVSLTATQANESAIMLSTYAGTANFYPYDRSSGAVYVAYSNWGTGQYSWTGTYFTDT